MGTPMIVRALAVALVVTTGCSFITVRGPGPERPGKCTRAPIAPVIDTGLTALAVIGAVTAHRRLDEPDGGEFPNNDFLRMQRTFSIIGGVLELAAAGYGFVKTTQCRRAHADFSARSASPPPPARSW